MQNNGLLGCFLENCVQFLSYTIVPALGVQVLSQFPEPSSMHIQNQGNIIRTRPRNQLEQSAYACVFSWDVDAGKEIRPVVLSDANFDVNGPNPRTSSIITNNTYLGA